MNSIELFARSRVNSIELFARSRANSTELFVRDRANSTEPRSELFARLLREDRCSWHVCTHRSFTMAYIFGGVYVHAGSVMDRSSPNFGRVSPRIHHACTRINAFSLLWTASCWLCTYVL